ncbi:MAG: hypothetical protein QRY74_02670 [Chlamydia sp.]
MTIQGDRIDFTSYGFSNNFGQKASIKAYTGSNFVKEFFAKKAGKANYCTVEGKEYCYNINSMKSFIQRNGLADVRAGLSKEMVSSIILHITAKKSQQISDKQPPIAQTNGLPIIGMHKRPANNSGWEKV